MTLAALHALARRRRSGAGRHAGRPDGRRRGGLQRARCARGARRGRRRDRHARRHAGPARDRLRLHPRRRSRSRRRRAARRRVRREARPGDRRALSRRRRLLLEQRHVRRARLGVARRARALPARHRGGDARRLGARAQSTTQLRATGQGRVRRHPRRIGRLRGDGAVRWHAGFRRAHGAAGRRLVRPRRLGRGVAGRRKDADGNATHGDVLARDSRNTLVHATSRLVGVGRPDGRRRRRDARRGAGRRPRAQPGREGDRRPARRAPGAAKHTLHRQVHRPWGWYDSIDAGPRFQVKRIMVKPGASLEPADAPPPRRALDRRVRHRRSDQRRRRSCC